MASRLPSEIIADLVKEMALFARSSASIMRGQTARTGSLRACSEFFVVSAAADPFRHIEKHPYERKIKSFLWT
jgi:hypothetical protein